MPNPRFPYRSPQPYARLDLSGGVQSATSRFLRRKNEVISSVNAVFNKKIGSMARRPGYEQLGTVVEHGNDGLGMHVYKYFGNNKLVVGINDPTDSVATLRVLDVGDTWSTIYQHSAPSTRYDFANYLDEMYVAGYAEDTNIYQPLLNFNSTLEASLTRNVAFAPKAKFVTDFQNGLVALGCEVNGAKYPDRFYISSPALGAITFVQNDQVGLLQQLQVDSARYLKAGMTIDIYSAGTNAKVVDSLTIVSVNKARNIITFTATRIDVKDNDELWLENRKDQLSILWNTDYPTPESADWKRIPPTDQGSASITGYGKNNGRFLVFSENSAWKFDGANLVPISETIGSVAPKSVRNIGGWTLWLHTTGVWGYNDASGQLKLLSRGVSDYIAAINQARIHLASAVVVGRIYKLSVGEIANLEASTTSTSTSSTSTSSTSSSTSSTSTSSTSTSSTSTSTSSNTTTSTSSSTSSTSSSTSSTMTTTTATTSSTTTVASTKKVVRLVYDFDSNTWWQELHKREHRDQLMYTMHGYTKPYFQDETGRVYRDETGNLDGVDTIPLEVELGRDHCNTLLKKNFTGCIISSEKARGTLFRVQLDNGNWRTVGTITEDIQPFKFPPGMTGRDINCHFSQNAAGEPPLIDGPTLFFTLDETKVS